MAAKSKEDLLAITEKEYGKLTKTLAGIDAVQAENLGEDEVSIKDTISHRVHWVHLFLGWYKDGHAGKAVHTPAPGYKWTELKAYNAKIREAERSKTWNTAKSELETAHKELVALIESLDETVLYGGRLYDWMNDWTLGRWAEASGASHYRSANKYIRKLLREQAAAT